MGFQICMGAMLQCSFGTAPSALSVLPVNRVAGATPCANIMDNVPTTNIMPFGQCSSFAWSRWICSHCHSHGRCRRYAGAYALRSCHHLALDCRRTHRSSR